MVVNEQLLVGYRLENDGDPSKGTILWLKDIHHPPDYLTQSLPGGKSNPHYLSIMEAIIKCQHGILIELDRLGITDIFPEDQVETFRASDSPPFHREIWLGENIGGLEAFLLSQFRAPLIYAGLNHRVTLHKTISKEEIVRIHAITKQMYECHEPIPMDLIVQRLQQLTIKEMDDFLSQNPGAWAVLVYGGRHDFSRGWTTRQPLIYSRRFYEI